MTETILYVGGWTLFFLFLYFYVGWIGLERRFFAGEDPEDWNSHYRAEEAPLDSQQPEPSMRLSVIPSLGRPA
ncbi:MAG TPA: hypothetical protein VLM91_06440 [Candidatus Methylomirabilis sp.]|nr:hypothetical protein [Candidatus Methylomirabilis sp.]